MNKAFLRALVAVLCGMLLAPAAFADDEDDVRAVIDRYIATETTDLADQAKLMTDDRVYISGGIRTTDNVSNMKAQIAGQNLVRQVDPDRMVMVRAEDVMVRVYGDAAVASFYRYWTVVPGADAVRAGANPQGPPDQVVTLVLAKNGRDWKIVHTHQSLMGSPQ